MAKSLERLIDDRRQMLDVLQRNGSAAGIQRLLTDLYPDSAHFVYELLQNAEDAGATSVEFVLDTDGVYFAHNGAREFTLEDVDAITSIGGNLGKREDSTSIGEFGVGFKAVFSYTLTPEIHSGGFHFRIRDHFLVETDGVVQEFLRHKAVERWTEFDLPFNNPEKPRKRAFEETLRGLERLDETSLLFLRNIASIEWSVEGSAARSGYARRTEHSDGRIELACKGSHGGEREVAFLRFSRDETVTSERGKKKTLPISVAYALSEGEEGKVASIVPVDGKTFVYFPAEKEHSGLRFHVNAPFSATVARDSIRDCVENDALMESVASLVAESLGVINERGMLGTSLYAVLPNSHDALPRAYAPILESVIRAFAENQYLVAKFGGRVRSVDALRGAREYSDLLTGDLLESFAGVRARWITTQPRNTHRRENEFLDTLGIAEFDAYDFAVAFEDKGRRVNLIAEASVKDIAWLKLLYQAFYSVYMEWRAPTHEELGVGARKVRALAKFVPELRSTAFVRCLDCALHEPGESFFILEGFSADAINDPIVDPRLVSDDARGRYYNPAGIRDMLRACGVETYSLEVELRRLVAKYSSIDDSVAPEVAKDPRYYNDVRNLAKAHAAGIEVSVAGINMFVGRTPEGKSRFFAAEDLALGSDFGVDIGDELAAFQVMPTVHPVYTRMLKGDDLDLFTKFMKHAGAWTGLRIVECGVQDNPEYSRMKSRGGTITSRGAQYDFTIRGLPGSLEHITPAVSYAIWQLLYEQGSTPKYTEAYYRSNARSEAQSADSQLVYHLKNHAWLPDIVGNLHRPGEIKFQDLEPAYREIGEGKLIAALDLGSELSAQKIAENRLKSEAERLGQHVISDEDFKLLLRIKEQERKAAEKQAAKEAHKLGAQEYLNKQNKDQRPSKLEGGREDPGSVRNPERRAKKIDETIKDLEQLPMKKRSRFSLVVESNERERETLREWYRGRCQVCDTVILRHDGEPLFEAINVINSSDLPDRHRRSVELAWNSLCLCPNCAAKYRFSGKKLSGFMDQVSSAEVIPGSDDRIPIRIELAGRTTDIAFAPKHFVALRQGLKRLDEGG